MLSFSNNLKLNLTKLNKFQPKLINNNNINFNFATKIKTKKDLKSELQEKKDNLFYEKVKNSGIYNFDPMKEYHESKLKLRNKIRKINKLHFNDKISFNSFKNLMKNINMRQEILKNRSIGNLVNLNEPEIEYLENGRRKFLDKGALRKRQFDKDFINEKFSIKFDKNRNRYITGNDLNNFRFSGGKNLLHEFSVGEKDLLENIKNKKESSWALFGLTGISLYFQNIFLTPFFLYLYLKERKEYENLRTQGTNKIKRISLLKNGKQAEIILESDKAMIIDIKNIRRLGDANTSEESVPMQLVLIRNNNIERLYEIRGNIAENKQEIFDLVMNGILFDFAGRFKESMRKQKKKIVEEAIQQEIKEAKEENNEKK